ncbi:cold shock domain-containing protein [Undibacterium fentianense]|uniref:Cold shock domain-containing protein n=1 Tax=Undibacterium fentianense TaxID=2828728 RepID=A0A941E1U3_9BURK|nr:cold shock domain-containing protein [Undibacterium fentianense]MBR7799836.1 cold shock domain-containing protein [Undibacterium fentianense]
MRFEGTLSKWNDDRGFGFIKPKHGDQDIFVHISAFPKVGTRPRIGENLSFEFQVGQDRKREAKNLKCLDRSTTKFDRQRLTNRTKSPVSSKPLLNRIVSLAFFTMIGLFAYDQFSRRASFEHDVGVAESENEDVSQSAVATANSRRFQCDGRQHCSQMTSCEEAKYFLKNCPNPKMDGDYDGIPCEQNLCTSVFSN